MLAGTGGTGERWLKFGANFDDFDRHPKTMNPELEQNAAHKQYKITKKAIGR